MRSLAALWSSMLTQNHRSVQSRVERVIVPRNVCVLHSIRPRHHEPRVLDQVPAHYDSDGQLIEAHREVIEVVQ